MPEDPVRLAASADSSTTSMLDGGGAGSAAGGGGALEDAVSSFTCSFCRVEGRWEWECVQESHSWPTSAAAAKAVLHRRRPSGLLSSLCASIRRTKAAFRGIRPRHREEQAPETLGRFIELLSRALMVKFVARNATCDRPRSPELRRFGRSDRHQSAF